MVSASMDAEEILANVDCHQIRFGGNDESTDNAEVYSLKQRFKDYLVYPLRNANIRNSLRISTSAWSQVFEIDVKGIYTSSSSSKMWYLVLRTQCAILLECVRTKGKSRIVGGEMLGTLEIRMGEDLVTSDEEEDYALMACNSSGSDTEVTSYSNECKESYAKLKKLYDAQREQLSDASIEIKAYTQGLKKVEAQLVAHQQGQLWYEKKIRFMKIDLDDKTDVLSIHRNIGRSFKEKKKDLKVKYDGILSYENEVLQSVFMGKESDFENPPLYDRFVIAGGMHAVPPPMTGNYMPSGPDIEIDYS
ncbi:hypothetical protein Tco_0425617 [Tanacetum coccineum]